MANEKLLVRQRRRSLLLVGLSFAALLLLPDTGLSDPVLRRPQRVLEELKRVDGAGSGLDADTLRGLAPDQLIASAQSTQLLAALATEVHDLRQRLASLERSCAASQPDIASSSPGGDKRSALESLLASASVVDGGKTLRLSGINLQIVSGTGRTNATPNGLGNLIVGYNESREPCDDESDNPCPSVTSCGSDDARDCQDRRTGSHNVIVGAGNNYTGFGGLVVGKLNTLRGWYSSVTAGEQNEAMGAYASVTGGYRNLADGEYSAVTGGYGNYAKGRWSWVGGGSFNRALGGVSSVCGGTVNSATGNTSSVAGGDQNEARGESSSVGGGHQRVAPAQFDWVAGEIAQDD